MEKIELVEDECQDQENETGNRPDIIDWSPNLGWPTSSRLTPYNSLAKPRGSGDYTPGAGLKPPPTPTEYTRFNHPQRACMGGCRCAAAAREARRRARNHGNALQRCSSGWKAHAWTTHACCAHESNVQQHLHVQDESSYASMHANHKLSSGFAGNGCKTAIPAEEVSQNAMCR